MTFFYPVGAPFWRAAARHGVPLVFHVRVHKDADTNSYWAESDDLRGLVVSGGDLDELEREILSAADALLDIAIVGERSRAKAKITLDAPLPCAA